MFSTSLSRSREHRQTRQSRPTVIAIDNLVPRLACWSLIRFLLKYTTQLHSQVAEEERKEKVRFVEFNVFFFASWSSVMEKKVREKSEIIWYETEVAGSQFCSILSLRFRYCNNCASFSFSYLLTSWNVALDFCQRAWLQNTYPMFNAKRCRSFTWRVQVSSIRLFVSVYRIPSNIYSGIHANECINFCLKFGQLLLETENERRKTLAFFSLILMINSF